MIAIYQAAHATDAHLMRNLLEQAGLWSFIRGEYLQGGLGDLPVTDMISVCVQPGDADAARAIVAEWNAGVMALHDDAPLDASHAAGHADGAGSGSFTA